MDAVTSPTAGHGIQNKYTFWYMKRGRARNPSESYEDSIKQLGTFHTVEGFWSLYNHIVRPNDISDSTELHLFKHGIKPLWEDENNARGGKMMIRLKKGLASHFWEDLLLSIIGEQFDVGNEICGAVISIRTSEDILSVWNRNADNQDALNKIQEHLRALFDLPTFISIDYKRHDNSSFGGHRTRRNSSVGSDGDPGNVLGSSANSGGSAAAPKNGPTVRGGKWRSRRMMQQKATLGGDATPPTPGGGESWMSSGSGRDRGSRGYRDHHHSSGVYESGGSNGDGGRGGGGGGGGGSRTGGQSGRSSDHSGGGSWNNRGSTGFDRSRRDTSWGSRRTTGGGGGGDVSNNNTGGGGSGGSGGRTSFWRSADTNASARGGGGGDGGTGTNTNSGGFGDSSTSSSGRRPGSAWRSDNRWGRPTTTGDHGDATTTASGGESNPSS